MNETHQYVCYVLENTTKTHTYVGITNNLKRRLRQHNGEIRGGARYTRGGRPWTLAAVVAGFKNKSDVLSFEWFMHRRPPYVPNTRPLTRVQRRIQAAQRLMTRDRFSNMRLRIFVR